MDQVLQYEIPVLHAIAVHFPIAFLLAAVFTAIPWLVRGRAFWRNVTSVLCTLGAAGAAFAYFTGEAMEEFAEGTPIVDEIVGVHESLGLYTLILSVAATLSLLLAVRLGVSRIAPTDPVVMRTAIFLLVAAAAVLVALTGHAGGVMVWGIAR